MNDLARELLGSFISHGLALFLDSELLCPHLESAPSVLLAHSTGSGPVTRATIHPEFQLAVFHINLEFQSLVHCEVSSLSRFRSSGGCRSPRAVESDGPHSCHQSCVAMENRVPYPHPTFVPSMEGTRPIIPTAQCSCLIQPKNGKYLTRCLGSHRGQADLSESAHNILGFFFSVSPEMYIHVITIKMINTKTGSR